MKFTKDFFCEEERCGFVVPAMMKRAWAAQMEVLEVINEICNRNGIKYFSDWGTTLGAIRHGGFIPWDDDIDICLLRKDYMRLIQILPRELPEGFVVAGMYATEKRLQDAAYVPQLRVIADETKWDFNDYMKRFHGFPYQRVGLDIFPLDNVPKDVELSKTQRGMARQGLKILFGWEQLVKQGDLQKFLRDFELLCNVKIPEHVDVKNYLWRMVDAICSLYEGEEVDEVTNYTTWTVAPTYKKEWYSRMEYVPFEQTMIPVPVAYHEVLTRQYGDYMVPVQGKTGHNYPFYGHMEEELLKQIRAVGFNGDVESFCEKVSCGELRV